jgi:hypothetical protein
MHPNPDVLSSPAAAPASPWRRQVVARLAAASSSPHRTAAAFALGTFLSFSPFLGFQIAIGLGAAVLLRLSRIAVVVGLCTNLPWIMLPWYTATTLGAAAILGLPRSGELGARLSELLDLPVYRAVFWERAGDLIAPFFWSFVIGPTVGATLVGAGAYVFTLRVLTRHHASAARLPGGAQQ